MVTKCLTAFVTLLLCFATTSKESEYLLNLSKRESLASCRSLTLALLDKRKKSLPGPKQLRAREIGYRQPSLLESHEVYAIKIVAASKLFFRNADRLTNFGSIAIEDDINNTLQSINMGNGEKELIKQIIYELAQIAYINSANPMMTNLSLYAFPTQSAPDLHRLERLETIHSYNASLKSLENICPLPLLSHCFFEKNDLQSTKGIGKFSALKMLFLGKNKLTSLEELCQLTNLEELGLDSNRLTSFTELGHLPKLKYLYLSSNEITSLEGISQLPNLECLTVENNPLTSLEEVSQLHKLRKLFLSSNQCDLLVGVNLPKDLRVIIE